MKWVRVRGVVMVGSGADEGVGGLRRLCSWVGLQSKASKRGFKAKAELSPDCGRPSLKPGFHRPAAGQASSQAFRSEEHTSELQSLMRISYAVFCLTKKNQ